MPGIKRSEKAKKTIGTIGLVVSILLCPPVFMLLFSSGDMLPEEIRNLWIFCSLYFMLSFLIYFQVGKLISILTPLFFTFHVLIFVELVARLVLINIIDPATLAHLNKTVNLTYNVSERYEGHPFLGHIGIPNDVGSGTNKLGFIGTDFSYIKPENTVRIACLGGSTTASGYPSVMEQYIQSGLKNDSVKIEALNFGVPHWTSVHSTINFSINVVDFEPDYVIIHHAWNEGKIRNVPWSDFRRDYSHVFKPFAPEPINDKYPLRSSMLYRYIKFKVTGDPDWIYIGSTIMKKKPKLKDGGNAFENKDELLPFKRNVTAITDLALAKKIKVILSTQPYSISSENKNAENIRQCNEILRALRQTYSNNILFLDLDSAMTRTMDSVFIDLGHMNEFGLRYKAEQFGSVIIHDLNRSNIIDTIPEDTIEVESTL